MTTADWNKLLNALTIGTVAGGSLSAMTGLARYLKGQAQLKDNESDDDDVMYIYKKSTADADEDKTTVFGDGLAMASGVGAAAGSVLLGNWLINRLRRQQAQNALDEAQRVLLETQGYGQLNKNASTLAEQIGNITGIADVLNSIKKTGHDAGSAATAMGLLTMLAAGVGTHAYLSNKFPTKKTTPKAPTRFRIVQVPDDFNGDFSSLPISKMANVKELDESDALIPAAVALFNMDKKASVTSNIISAVAQGRTGEFEKAVFDMGFENAVNIVKGASTKDITPTLAALAAVYCTKEASFSEQFKLAAAAEFQALHPEFCKAAACLPEPMWRKMNGLSKVAGAVFCHDLACELTEPTDLEKSASDTALCTVGNIMRDVITKMASALVTTNNKATASDLSNGGNAEASHKDASLIKEDADKFQATVDKSLNKTVEQDKIDTILAPSQEGGSTTIGQAAK